MPRKRLEEENHVWSYDFVSNQTHNGKKFRVLNIIDEYTRECLSCHIARSITANDVLFVLSQRELQR